ncbi:MAG TPA: outer membrane protein assembly factor BamC [Azoarcus taiwanensis]|nr:outer membrane protein assembly factor BamC [Azoarcus taiwanensis]
MKASRLFPLSVIAMSVALVGCSTSGFEGKKIDYKSARQVSPLELPPDLTGMRTDDRFALPTTTGVATFSGYTADRAAAPVSGASNVLVEVEGMRIERAGTQRWLVVPGNADVLWPDIKDFWMELGFILNIDRPEIGVMETDWAEDRARIPMDFVRATIGRVFDGLFSTSERDKFRTRLEEGKEPGTVEIYISHRGMKEVYTSEREERTVWQPREPDPELEAEMLRRLMVRLGVEEERAAVMVARADVPQRAALQTGGEGQTLLVVDESFDRAWRRVGLALDRSGFTVEDRDRSQGLFFVRYIDPDADARSQRSPGVLSRMAFWRDTDASAVTSGAEYRIRVASDGSQSVVTVLTREGGEDRSVTARRILEVLHNQLR